MTDLLDSTQQLGVTNGRYVVVSSDGHVGPSVGDHLRPYCEAKHLADFDRFADELAGYDYNSAIGFEIPEEHIQRISRHGQTPGLHDPHARLRDMDADGIAAEVLFHGGINGQSIPFSAFGVGAWGSVAYKSLEAVGYHIYNRWLADYVSASPTRLIGVVHIPVWNIDAAVKEVEWAKSVGLQGVNLPAQRRDFPGVNQPVWEPLWRVCEELEMPLFTHAGAGDYPGYSGVESTALWMLETPFYGRRNLWHLIFGGVFERHPGLRFVLSEQFGDWIPECRRDMDSAYLAPHQRILREVLPEKPTFYWERNCFVGASFMAEFEAKMSIDHNYDHKMMWGADYPHSEGTWPRTRLAMRKTFSDLPSDSVAKMLGGNALGVLHLDVPALVELGGRIGPTVEEVATPIDEFPDFRGCAFRDVGKFA